MRLFKKLIFLLFVLSTIIVASGIVAAYLYQDKIEQLIVNELNKQLKTPIEINDVEFSVVKKFPYASLELSEVIILDALEKDSLLAVQKLFLKFNALDLYNGNYTIQQLEVINGKALVYFNKEGLPNYKIWHAKTDSSSNDPIQFGLEQVRLKNIHITYADKRNTLKIVGTAKEADLTGVLKNGIFSTQITGDFSSKHILVNNIKHLPKQDVKLWLSLDAASNNTSFKGVANIKNLELKVNGEVKDGYSVDVSGSQLNISQTLQLVPSEYLHFITGYQLNGEADINVHVENSNQSGKPAIIAADFSINNGQIKTNTPWVVTAANLSGAYTNGTARKNESSQVNVQQLDCQVNGEPLSGTVSIYNFDNPQLQTSFSTQLELSELYNWDFDLPLNKLSGKAKFNAVYNGQIGFKNNLTTDFLEAEKSADITVTNGVFQHSMSFVPLENINTHLKLNNEHLTIDSLSATMGEESKLQFNGAAENLFSYGISQTASLKIAGYLQSDWLLIDELLATDSTSEITAIQIPNDIQANITTSLKDVSYDRFRMRDFNSKVTFNKGVLKAKNIVLTTMSGDIEGDFSFEQVEGGKLRLITTAQLEKINVRQLFYEFNNFGQNTMRYKHLKGKTTCDVYLRTEWDKYFNALPSNLYAFLDMKITDGELINFEPMLLMSDYISVDELKRIKFSTLENQIEIKNKRVEIPFMKIHSTAMDVAGSGTHFFDNTIQYEIEFALNEVLGNKFRKKNKQTVSEFGDVETNGVKGTIIPLKMTGSVSDPIISFNFNRARNSVNEGLNNQKEDLKEIFQNEFDNEENVDDNLNESPDYNNMLEWNEDEYLH